LIDKSLKIRLDNGPIEDISRVSRDSLTVKNESRVGRMFKTVTLLMYVKDYRFVGVS